MAAPGTVARGYPAARPMTRRRRATAVLLAALASLLALAGCGTQRPGSSGQVTLLVTRDYGARPVGDAPDPQPPGSLTVLGLLRGSADVRGGTGGTPVRAVDGVAGPWSAYVNGVQIDDPATRRLRGGDRVWWDRHAGGGSAKVGAVIGSYPEPFADGLGGKRWPTRVECVEGGDRTPCTAISQRLGDRGVLAAQSLVGTEGGDANLRVLVGPWSLLRADRAARQIDQGPAASGVFARFSAGGRRLALLDRRGRTVRVVAEGGGLIAATRYAGQPPTWFITGTDAAGVAAAVQAFDEATLGDRFALAVADDQGVPLPVRSGAP